MGLNLKWPGTERRDNSSAVIRNGFLPAIPNIPYQTTPLLDTKRLTESDIVTGDTLNRYAAPAVDRGNVVLNSARATVVKRQ